MENTKSPFDTLFGESLPRLLQAIDEYHALAAPHCSPEQIQLLAELSRRIKQCDLLLRSTGGIAQRQLVVALDMLAVVAGKQPDADERFGASCQDIDAMWLFTESFYWIAYKVTLIVTAEHKCFKGKRLPKLSSNFPFGGVGNVRNWLIEHPFDYNNQFGLGGMYRGPVLNGGLGKDSKGKEIKDHGLYHNAIEWADIGYRLLSRASEELRKEV